MTTERRFRQNGRAGASL